MAKDEIKVDNNLLRGKAHKLEDVTNEKWCKVNKGTQSMVAEFLSMRQDLSPETLKQYTSALRIFFYWVYENLGDKDINKISKRDFLRFINMLVSRNDSSSAIKFKKSSVSSMCNYIENIVAEDDDDYKTFRNFTRGLPPIQKNQVYDKKPVTRDEYNVLIEHFISKNKFLQVAWLAVAFNVGGRRSEILQFKTSILDKEIPEGKNFVVSDYVRGKGAGKDGKPLRFLVNEEALKHMRKYVEERGFESDLIFSKKFSDGRIDSISKTWANDFCKNHISKILGRRITPHNFKAGLVTRMLEDGKDLTFVSRVIAHHNGTDVTTGYYDLRNFDDEIDLL